MNRASLHPLTNSSPITTPVGQSVLQRQVHVGASNDSVEHEADRVADHAVSSRSAPAISTFNFGKIQREEKTGSAPKDNSPKEKTDEEKYTEGAKKLGEAFLATPLGKQLIERLKQDALVKGATQIGKDFIATWPGKIITGAAAAGAITTLAATHKELPMQIPEIPLDFVTPGLSIQLTYNGPVDKPTDAMLTFKFTEQTPAAGSASKKLSASEQYRADTAKMAADQAKFKAGLITPGSPEDLQQKAEQEEINKIAQKYAGRGPDIDAMIKKYPWLATPEPKTGLQLNTPKFGTGYQAPSIFGDQFKLNLPSEKKKKSDETGLQKKLSIGASNDPFEAEADRVADQVVANNSAPASINNSISNVQRHSTTSSETTDDVPASVNQTLSGSGKPLDKTVRANMESRFGHDFSQVRIHQGGSAEKSARDVNANAYTLGNNIVFGAGQYNPESQTGKRLLAHELTHVVQQSNVIRPYRPSDAFNFGKLDTPTLKEDSFNFKKDKESKPWVKKVDVNFTTTKKDADGNNFWLGKANVHYYDNPVKLPDFAFDIAGGSAELGKSDKGDFEVHRIEGVGYNSGSFSAPFKNSEREGPNKRYSKDLAANMSYAVFYNKGEALHAGPIDASSHGCVHVTWANIQQLNYHSVIGKTKVSVTYP